MGCCTARRFLIVICTLQLLLTIEQLVFSFLGFMWAPIAGGFIHILFTIVAIFGSVHYRPRLLTAYAVWACLWIACNAVSICLYQEVGSLDKSHIQLVLAWNGNGESYWRTDIGCSSGSRSDSSRTPGHSSALSEFCVLDASVIETIQCGLQIFLTLIGCLVASYVVCLITEEDDSSKHAKKNRSTAHAGSHRMTNSSDAFSTINDPYHPGNDRDPVLRPASSAETLDTLHSVTDVADRGLRSSRRSHHNNRSARSNRSGGRGADHRGDNENSSRPSSNRRRSPIVSRPTVRSTSTDDGSGDDRHANKERRSSRRAGRSRSNSNPAPRSRRRRQEAESAAGSVGPLPWLHLAHSSVAESLPSPASEQPPPPFSEVSPMGVAGERGSSRLEDLPLYAPPPSRGIVMNFTRHARDSNRSIHGRPGVNSGFIGDKGRNKLGAVSSSDSESDLPSLPLNNETEREHDGGRSSAQSAGYAALRQSGVSDRHPPLSSELSSELGSRVGQSVAYSDPRRKPFVDTSNDFPPPPSSMNGPPVSTRNHLTQNVLHEGMLSSPEHNNFDDDARHRVRNLQNELSDRNNRSQAQHQQQQQDSPVYNRDVHIQETDIDAMMGTQEVSRGQGSRGQGSRGLGEASSLLNPVSAAASSGLYNEGPSPITITDSGDGGQRSGFLGNRSGRNAAQGNPSPPWLCSATDRQSSRGFSGAFTQDNLRPNGAPNSGPDVPSSGISGAPTTSASSGMTVRDFLAASQHPRSNSDMMSPGFGDTLAANVADNYRKRTLGEKDILDVSALPPPSPTSPHLHGMVTEQCSTENDLDLTLVPTPAIPPRDYSNNPTSRSSGRVKKVSPNKKASARMSGDFERKEGHAADRLAALSTNDSQSVPETGLFTRAGPPRNSERKSGRFHHSPEVTSSLSGPPATYAPTNGHTVPVVSSSTGVGSNVGLRSSGRGGGPSGNPSYYTRAPSTPNKLNNLNGPPPSTVMSSQLPSQHTTQFQQPSSNAHQPFAYSPASQSQPSMPTSQSQPSVPIGQSNMNGYQSSPSNQSVPNNESPRDTNSFMNDLNYPRPDHRVIMRPLGQPANHNTDKGILASDGPFVSDTAMMV